jgi:hypothetical protein
VKYMVMLLGDQAGYESMSGRGGSDGPAWTPDLIKAMVEHMQSINDDLAAAGELVEAQGLDEPAKTKQVRVKDGALVVTDGPYGESKEVLAGYWVIDVPSEQRALEIAARAYQCPQPEGLPDIPVLVQPIGEAPDPHA